MVWALRRHRPIDRVLLVTLAAYFLSVGMSFVLEAPRYYIPMVPILMVFARACSTSCARRGSAFAVFACVWLYAAAFTVSQVARYSFSQQKDLAHWVKTVLPPRAAGAPRARVAYPQGVDPYYGLRQPIDLGRPDALARTHRALARRAPGGLRHARAHRGALPPRRARQRGGARPRRAGERCRRLSAGQGVALALPAVRSLHLARPGVRRRLRAGLDRLHRLLARGPGGAAPDGELRADARPPAVRAAQQPRDHGDPRPLPRLRRRSG